MLKKGWNFKEELYKKNNQHFNSITFFNHIIKFSEILNIDLLESEKKEKIIELAAKCLYEDFQNNYSSL